MEQPHKAFFPEPPARLLCRLALLALLAACDTEPLPPDYQAWRAQRRDDFGFPAQGITGIVLDNIRGNTNVTPWEHDSIQVCRVRYSTGLDSADAESCLAYVTAGDSIASGTLFLWGAAGDSGPRNAGVDFSFLVPESVALELRALDGNVTTQLMCSRVEIELRDGSISLARHAGGVFIRSDSGSVACQMERLAPDDSVRIEAGKWDGGSTTLSLPGDVSARFEAEATGGDLHDVVVDSFPDLRFTYHRDERKVGTIGAGDADIFIRVAHQTIHIENADNRPGSVFLPGTARTAKTAVVR